MTHPQKSHVGLFAALAVAVAVGWLAGRLTSLPREPLPDPAATSLPAKPPAATAAEGLSRASAEPAMPAESPQPPDAQGPPAAVEEEERGGGRFDQELVEKRLRATVELLAADELEGRGPRTRGLELAAEYLVQQFDEIGLRGDLINGAPLQEFAFGPDRPSLGTPNELIVFNPEGQAAQLVLGEEYMPLSIGVSGNFEVPLAFAGYGIEAPRLGYNDYATLDVSGKAVIVLRREPRQDDPASPFNGRRSSEHAYFKTKIDTAVRHGARAVVLCTDAHSLAPGMRLASAAGGLANDPDPLLDFEVPAGQTQRVVPVFHVRRRIVDQMVQSVTGRTLEEIERTIDADMAPQSFALRGWRLSGEVSISYQRSSLKNVLALLPGEGTLAAETIIVGAHYDHLGRGGASSLAPWTVDIHNGADDNASGTAVMLEVARMLAARPRPLPRSVLFIAFTAEELGLLGSEEYVRRPVVPLERTIAMVNLDMVGRLRDELTVYGLGTAREFPALVDNLAAWHQLKIDPIASGYGPSDHATFHERGIPVLFLFTGLHSDYHRPSDDAEKLNYEGMRRIARLTADVVTQLATAPQRPQRPGQDLAQRTPSRTPQQTPADQGGPQLGVTIWPAQGGGFRIEAVRPGSTADRGGIRTGDILLEFDGAPVVTPQGLRDTLGTHQVGQTVSAVVRRGEFELELKIPLRGR